MEGEHYHQKDQSYEFKDARSTESVLTRTIRSGSVRMLLRPGCKKHIPRDQEEREKVC